MKIKLVMILLLIAVSGCVFAENKTVKYIDFKVYDPVYVGIEKGFFKGVKVELMGSYLAGPTAIQAVSSGKYHAGLSSIMAIINANANGLPVQGITDIQSAITGQPLEEWFVKSNSTIKNIQDLKGKRIAVNLWKSSFHYSVIMALNNAGMKSDDVQFILIPFDKQLTAIDSDQVDVVGLMEPYSSYLRSKGGYRVLFDAFDIFGEKQFCIHFVNKVWAEHNRKEAVAFISGIVKSINWIEQNQAEAKKIIAKYTGIDEKYIADYHFQKNGAVIMNDVQYWLDYMQSSGDVTAKWLKVDDIATNKYNREVK